MKTRIHKLQADGLYLIQSKSSANSLYFEFTHDHTLFFHFLNKYLSEIIDVVHYSLTETGWSLLFRTKDSISIQEAYRARRTLSKKANPLFEKTEVADMLSEHFRYFISAYVKQSNLINSRTGSKVHSRMEKYIFPNEDSLLEEVDKMESNELIYQQSEERYCPKMEDYEVREELNDDDLRISAKSCYGIEKLTNTVVESFLDLLFQITVVRKLIKSTWQTHFNRPNPQNPHPRLE